MSKIKEKKEYTESYLNDKMLLDYTERSLHKVIDYIKKYIEFKGDKEDFTIHLMELESKESADKGGIK